MAPSFVVGVSDRRARKRNKVERNALKREARRLAKQVRTVDQLIAEAEQEAIAQGKQYASGEHLIG